MAKCKLSGKGPMHGNSVPWSKKTTKRQWQPNVQKYTVFVPELGRAVKIKASVRTMKTVNKVGLLAYLRKNNLTLKEVT